MRALAALLPKMRAVLDCAYACDPAGTSGVCEDCARPRAKSAVALKSHLTPVPVVDLPPGATEDRVVGELDLERALSQGVKAFEPGLLARAVIGADGGISNSQLIDIVIAVTLIECGVLIFYPLDNPCAARWPVRAGHGWCCASWLPDLPMALTCGPAGDGRRFESVPVYLGL